MARRAVSSTSTPRGSPLRRARASERGRPMIHRQARERQVRSACERVRATTRGGARRPEDEQDEGQGKRRRWQPSSTPGPCAAASAAAAAAAGRRAARCSCKGPASARAAPPRAGPLCDARAAANARSRFSQGRTTRRGLQSNWGASRPRMRAHTHTQRARVRTTRSGRGGGKKELRRESLSAARRLWSAHDAARGRHDAASTTTTTTTTPTQTSPWLFAFAFSSHADRQGGEKFGVQGTRAKYKTPSTKKGKKRSAEQPAATTSFLSSLLSSSTVNLSSLKPSP